MKSLITISPLSSHPHYSSFPPSQSTRAGRNLNHSANTLLTFQAIRFDHVRLDLAKMVSLVGHSALARTLLVIGLSTTAQGQFFTVYVSYHLFRILSNTS